MKASGLILNNACVPCAVPVHNWLDHGMQFMVGRGARRRRVEKVPLELGVAHWTGGENPPETMFRVLQRRELGVEFAIDRDGTVYQFADPVLVDTFDAGYVNKRSWGCEIVNYGYRGKLSMVPRRGRDRETYTDTIHGRRREMARFASEQVDSFIALAEAIHGHLEIPLCVPTEPNGELLRRAMSRGEMKSFSGIVGHYHVTDRKLDPGTDLLNECLTHWHEEPAAKVA